MDKIPEELIKSLMELGLLESEAKIYVTLVMMNNSEVKKLINFLGLSKPNTYESLRLLKEKGLVVLINNKPMTYQATPPDVGLEILLKTHLIAKEKAKEKAKQFFSTLNKEKFVEKPSETLWHVFGGNSIEYKINDMIQNAKESVFIALSPKYLNYLEKLDKDLKLDVITFTGDPNVEENLNNLFKDKKSNLRIIREKNIIGESSAEVPDEEFNLYKEAFSMFNYENMLMLIVDDSELLFIPPVSEDSMSAINTKNKAFIMIMKIEFLTASNPFIK